MLDRNIVITLRDLACGKKFRSGRYGGNHADRNAVALFTLLKLLDIRIAPSLAIIEGSITRHPAGELAAIRNATMLSRFPYREGEKSNPAAIM